MNFFLSRSTQWATASLIMCLHSAACANACGTNRGWQPFCFSVAQIYVVLMQESGLIFTCRHAVYQIGMSMALFHLLLHRYPKLYERYRP